MEMTDKAVSTEDLCLESRRGQQQQQQQHQNSTCLEVVKLEGVLNSLLESKVEAIKNGRTSSIHSSPKMLINRLRITSTSTTSSKDKDSGHSQSNRKHRRRKNSDEIGLARAHRLKKTGRRRQRISSSSPESAPRYSIGRCCEQTPPLSDEDVHQAFLAYDAVCSADKCIPSGHNPHTCCCRHDHNGDVQMHFEEDYISLKIEDYDGVEEETMIAQEELKRARRKRRKRRKRRMKRHHIGIAAVPVEEESVKVLEPDDLPQRARWTIVATACLLLFMCLLLVGVTLRMAPIIDELVRKENEEMMNSLSREPQSFPNTSSPDPD